MSGPTVMTFDAMELEIVTESPVFVFSITATAVHPVSVDGVVLVVSV